MQWCNCKYTNWWWMHNFYGTHNWDVLAGTQLKGRTKKGNTIFRGSMSAVWISLYAKYANFSEYLDYCISKIDWLIDLWIDLLIDCLINQLIDWMIEWLIKWLIDWLIDRLIYCLIRRQLCTSGGSTQVGLTPGRRRSLTASRD